MAPLMLAAGLTHAANVLREAGNRVVGLPEAGGTLAGSRRPKKLRLSVAILRDERGRPVATPADVLPALDETRRVLREQLAVQLVPAAGALIRTLELPAPREALDAPCAEGSYRADLGLGGAFFRRFAARGAATGSGAPITVFIVRDVLGKAGCSLGPLVDYVTVDMTGLTGRTKRVLVHELGHACGLPHSRSPGTSCCRRAWARASSRGRSPSSAARATSRIASSARGNFCR